MKKRNTGPFLSLLITVANIFLSHSGVLKNKELAIKYRIEAQTESCKTDLISRKKVRKPAPS